MEESTENPVESASVLKPNAQLCSIREQILHDPVSGLTLQFERDDRGLTFLRIYGGAFGNRELIFDSDGLEAGAGSHVGSTCRPAWLTIPEEL
jgi:hypothetical protein